MTEPTDAEIIAVMRDGYNCRYNDEQDHVDFARAVLAKWGTPPAVAGEQVGWMWQHDETGRTGFVDCWQVENGWQEGNPRLRLISKLYATPQPTQAQAGAVPLTDEEVLDAFCRTPGIHQFVQAFWAGVRFAEQHHGIKGGQHGSDI